MAILEILQYPDPRLAIPCRARRKNRCRARAKLIDDMIETMYAAPGVGLAATQVDVHKQIIVIDVSEDRSDLRVFINPEITRREGVAVEPGGLPLGGRRLRQRRASGKRYRHRARSQRLALHAQRLRPACDMHPARDGPPAGQGLRRATSPSSSRTASARSSRSASARPPEARAGPFARRFRRHARLSPHGALEAIAAAGPRGRPRPHPARPSRRAAACKLTASAGGPGGASGSASRSRSSPTLKAAAAAAAHSRVTPRRHGGRRLRPASCPQAVLAIPALGCLNIHASLLPRWRGAAPIQRAILAGDAADRDRHHADGGRASIPGRSCSRRALPIGARDTTGTLDREAGDPRRRGDRRSACATCERLVAAPQDARRRLTRRRSRRPRRSIDWTLRCE